MRLRALLVVALIAGALGSAPTDVWARAGGGGSRGSRSFSAPARPAPRSYERSPLPPAAPAPTPTPYPRPSPFGGLMGGLAGFMVGGLLGSLLFGGSRGGFGGVGLLDLMLVVGGVVLLFLFLRRRQESPALATAGDYGGGVGVAPAPAPAPDELERGVAHIRQMDPAFDPAQFATSATAMLVRVQGAWAQGDMSAARDLLTPQMQTEMQAKCDALRAAGRTNRVEQIEVGRAEVTEAWQETGQDFVTVYFEASMLDYVVDARGAVEGSDRAPVRVEEFWTFTRPLGANRWKLSAIQPPGP